MRKWIGLLLLMSLFLPACKKEQPKDASAGNLLLLNEGTFNLGNAELSVYNQTTKTIYNNQFYQKNNYPLGDVAQSVTRIKEELFVVVNNSAKIEVLDAASFSVKRTLRLSQSSPRYMQQISDSVAMVTDLYADKIWYLNFYTGNIVRTATTNGWTEQLLKVNDKIMIVQKKRFNSVSSANALLVFNQNSVQTIPFSQDISAMESDGQNHVFLLLSGNSIAARIVKINTDNLTVETVFVFNNNETPSLLRFNPATGQMCFVMNGIYSLNGNAINRLVDLPIGNYYGFYIAQNGDFFVSDAIDFVQSSKVYHYDKNYTLLNTFYAGVNTNQFFAIYE